MHTPTTPAGLRKYDHLSPCEALRLAWTEPGPHPDWHAKTQEVVRDAMPLVARALERMAAEPRPERKYQTLNIVNGLGHVVGTIDWPVT